MSTSTTVSTVAPSYVSINFDKYAPSDDLLEDTSENVWASVTSSFKFKLDPLQHDFMRVYVWKSQFGISFKDKEGKVYGTFEFLDDNRSSTIAQMTIGKYTFFDTTLLRSLDDTYFTLSARQILDLDSLNCDAHIIGVSANSQGIGEVGTIVQQPQDNFTTDSFPASLLSNGNEVSFEFIFARIPEQRSASLGSLTIGSATAAEVYVSGGNADKAEGVYFIVPNNGVSNVNSYQTLYASPENIFTNRLLRLNTDLNTNEIIIHITDLNNTILFSSSLPGGSSISLASLQSCGRAIATVASPLDPMITESLSVTLRENTTVGTVLNIVTANNSPIVFGSGIGITIPIQTGACPLDDGFVISQSSFKELVRVLNVGAIFGTLSYIVPQPPQEGSEIPSVSTDGQSQSKGFKKFWRKLKKFASSSIGKVVTAVVVGAIVAAAVVLTAGAVGVAVVATTPGLSIAGSGLLAASMAAGSTTTLTAANVAFGVGTGATYAALN